MADTLSAAIDGDHPLALELSSLRSAVSRYQHEAHAASLKLQRHSLDTSQALDHARGLERENARLKEELAVLRAHPDTTPSSAAAQVSELTLALRRLSDKLTTVEETLFARTKEVVEIRSELAGVQHELDAARALTAEARAREEEGLARERALEQKVRAVEEERRLADLVVQEYAALVRKLEGRQKLPPSPPSTSTSSIDLRRSSNGSTTTLVDTLAEGKLGLQKLLQEFNSRNEQLQADNAQLHGDNGLLYKELEVACQGARHDRDELTKAIHELDKYRADDNTATKMVSRYMKFSQSSTDTLQKAMDALKVRHAATLNTLNAEITHLRHALTHEHDESDRVRTALDELTEDIAREAYGRRREVSLRLAFLSREENLAEHLRRWARKAKESLERSSGSEDGSISLDPMALREAFAKAAMDAEALLDTLNEQPSTETEGVTVGSIARLVLAQDTIASLTHELQEETMRRLNTERKLASLEMPERLEQRRDPDDTPPMVHPVPHRIAEERRFLDVGVTASIDEHPTANGSQLPDHITPSDSIPIVDVISPPTTEEVPTVLSVDSPSRSESIPTIPDESSTSSPIAVSVEMPNTQPSATPETVLDLVVSDETQPKLLQSELSASPSDAPEATEDATEDASAVPLPSGSESPAAELPSAIRPTLLSPTPPRGPVQDSASIPTLDVRDPHTKSRVPPPLSLEATGLALSSLSPGLTSASLPAEGDKETSLIADLAKVKHRYDEVQRGFRDCQLALKELKKSLGSLPSQTIPSSSDMASFLAKAVERLGDFNEDARVELEIRIADEERIASGYEALLSIPGAMSSSDDANTEKMDEREVIKEVRVFVDGTDNAVAKATQQFTQKLDDLEHDIASIKRSLYELTSSSDDSLSPSVSIPSAKPMPSPSWSAWTPSFLSPPRSTSPAPTFGSVMTSPRLRHSSSFSHPRERSTDDPPPDPLASLGLRIVIPPARSPVYSPGLSPSPLGGPRGGSRQRTTSGMFMLGLGMRGTSTPLGPRIGRQGLRETSSSSSLAGSSSPARLASIAVAGGHPHAAAAVTTNGGALEAQAGGHDSDVE